MASSLVTALRRFFAPQLAEQKKRELIETRRQSYFFAFFLIPVAAAISWWLALTHDPYNSIFNKNLKLCPEWAALGGSLILLIGLPTLLYVPWWYRQMRGYPGIVVAVASLGFSITAAGLAWYYAGFDAARIFFDDGASCPGPITEWLENHPAWLA